MANFIDPIQAAFGQYMGRYHAGLAQFPWSTTAMTEFAGRGLSRSIVWAPGRMIDQAEEILSSWRKNDNAGTDQPRPYLPMMAVAMAKDFLPPSPDYGRHHVDPISVMIPGDPKQRVFKLRTMVVDIRTQVAIFAAEQATARGLAMEFQGFCARTDNRRFYAAFNLAGVQDQWPVVLESPEVQFMSVPVEVKNLTILTADIQLRATVPVLMRPRGAEENDGKGQDTDADPNGYVVVDEVHGHTPVRDGENFTWKVGP